MSCLSPSGFMDTGTDLSLYLRYSFVRNGVTHNASQRMRFAPLFSSRSSLKNIFGLPALFRVVSLAPHWERFDTFLIPVWKAGVSVGGIYKITMKMNVTGDFVTILCRIRFYFLESQWEFAMGAVAWFSQAVDCRVNEDSCNFPWLVGLPRRDLCETGARSPPGAGDAGQASVSAYQALPSSSSISVLWITPQEFLSCLFSSRIPGSSWG